MVAIVCSGGDSSICARQIGRWLEVEGIGDSRFGNLCRISGCVVVVLSVVAILGSGVVVEVVSGCHIV